MNSRKIIRRRSQLNVYGVLPLGGATHHERRFHTNSWSVWRGKGWRWNPGWGANFLGGIWNEIATAKLFQSFCFVVLETFIKVGKTKGLARLEQSGSLTGPSGGSFDISNRKVELYVRTYSIQKIILFDSGYLVLKLGFLKNFLHSKLPPPSQRRPHAIILFMFSTVGTLSSDRKALVETLSSPWISEPGDSLQEFQLKDRKALIIMHYPPPKASLVKVHSKVNGGLESNQFPES